MGNLQETPPIRYRERASGELKTESVYGQKWLQWAYGNPLGRWSTRHVASRPWFSRWYGWRMRSRASRRKIVPFIEAFQLDVSEFLRPPDYFESFDAFFYRQLKPEARPVDADPASVVFPADGRHLGFADSARIGQVFVKGQRFALAALLGEAALAEKFHGGALVLSRLCPTDYHRFHFCIEGVAGTPRQGPRRIGGPLYSVNPIALRQRLEILWENKREITLIETAHCGLVAQCEIGATCVGTIVQTHVPGQHVAKGAEKGYFRFGGSSVITLFEPGRVTLADDLRESTAAGYELYAKMGEQMGTVA